MLEQCTPDERNEHVKELRKKDSRFIDKEHSAPKKLAKKAG